MRIGIVTELFPTTPQSYVGSFLVQQIQRLQSSVDITVFAPYFVPVTQVFKHIPNPKNGIQHTFVRCYCFDIQLLLTLRIISRDTAKVLIKKRAARKLLSVIKIAHAKKKFDIFHGHEVFIGDEVGMIGKKLNVPTVFTLHGQRPFHLEIFGKLVLQRALQNINSVNTVITVSNLVKKSYSNFITAPVVTIPNGYNPDPLVKTTAPRHIVNTYSKKIILYVGSLWAGKRVDLLLKAFQIVQKQSGGSCKLLIVGEGPQEKYLKQLSQNLGIDTDVKFAGSIDPKEIPSIYTLATLLVQPSKSESFSMVCLEAMAYGIPCVCSVNTGISEWLENDVNVKILFGESAEELASLIMSIIVHDELQSRLSINAKKVAETFRWENIIPKILYIYGKLQG